MVVQPRQLHRAKQHAPVSVVDLFEANELTNHRLAQVQFPSSPFDFTVASNATHGGAFGVLDLRLSERVRSLRGPEVLLRSRAAERFVRSLVVVILSKIVEPPLLRAQRALRRAGRFLFERAVHTLMSTVLLGFSRFDAFRHDAQFHPPYRQS